VAWLAPTVSVPPTLKEAAPEPLSAEGEGMLEVKVSTVMLFEPLVIVAEAGRLIVKVRFAPPVTPNAAAVTGRPEMPVAPPVQVRVASAATTIVPAVVLATTLPNWRAAVFVSKIGVMIVAVAVALAEDELWAIALPAGTSMAIAARAVRAIRVVFFISSLPLSGPISGRDVSVRIIRVSYRAVCQVSQGTR